MKLLSSRQQLEERPSQVVLYGPEVVGKYLEIHRQCT